MNKKRKNKGFSLVELAIVLAVIAALLITFIKFTNGINGIAANNTQKNNYQLLENDINEYAVAMAENSDAICQNGWNTCASSAIYPTFNGNQVTFYYDTSLYPFVSSILSHIPCKLVSGGSQNSNSAVFDCSNIGITNMQYIYTSGNSTQTTNQVQAPGQVFQYWNYPNLKIGLSWYVYQNGNYGNTISHTFNTSDNCTAYPYECLSLNSSVMTLEQRTLAKFNYVRHLLQTYELQVISGELEQTPNPETGSGGMYSTDVVQIPWVWQVLLSNSQYIYGLCNDTNCDDLVVVNSNGTSSVSTSSVWNNSITPNNPNQSSTVFSIIINNLNLSPTPYNIATDGFGNPNSIELLANTSSPPPVPQQDYPILGVPITLIFTQGCPIGQPNIPLICSLSWTYPQ